MPAPQGRPVDGAIAHALAAALVLCVRYIDERDVPDDIADDDMKVLESVASYLLEVPVELRPRLVDLVGPHLSAAAGLLEQDEQGTAGVRSG